jgi:HSP20 family protein
VLVVITMKRLPIQEELRQMRDEMNQMLHEVQDTTNLADKSSRSRPRRARRPVTKLTEKDDEYHLTAELPGVNKEDIDLTVTDNTVTIQVEHQDIEQTNKVTKQDKRSFYNQMRLPQDVNIDDAQASYSNGVLELRLPRQSQDNARKLEIQ